jgi:hypothetical protein
MEKKSNQRRTVTRIKHTGIDVMHGAILDIKYDHMPATVIALPIFFTQ